MELRQWELFLLRRIKGVCGFLYRLEGLYVALSRTERERGLESSVTWRQSPLLYTEKDVPIRHNSFALMVWVSVYFHATTVCQKDSTYPVILYVQWCKRKIIGCLASSVTLSVVPPESHKGRGKHIYMWNKIWVHV